VLLLPEAAGVQTVTLQIREVIAEKRTLDLGVLLAMAATLFLIETGDLEVGGLIVDEPPQIRRRVTALNDLPKHSRKLLLVTDTNKLFKV
jgi:hypothetical protein